MSEQLKISGKKVALPAPASEWSFIVRPGGWVLAERKNAAGSVERRKLALFERQGKLSFSLDGFLYHTDVIQKQRGGASAASVESELKAQFPGKVRKVLVAAGARVEEGTPLVLVEAMKMEFSIKAPVPGTVKAVLVKDGQQLAPGDRFVDFEPAKNGEAGAK